MAPDLFRSETRHHADDQAADHRNCHDGKAHGGVGDFHFLRRQKIGRAHVGTPVTNAHLVCRLLLEKKKTTYTCTHKSSINTTLIVPYTPLNTHSHPSNSNTTFTPSPFTFN